eukprot:509333_1
MQDIWDVYTVHKTYFEHVNKAPIYKLRDFYQTLLKNSSVIKHIKVNPEDLILHSLQHPVIELPSRYIIYDDLESISNKIFGTMQLVNYIITDDKEINNINRVNLIIVPRSVKSTTNLDDECYNYAHMHLEHIQNEYKCIKCPSKMTRIKFYEEIKTIYDKIMHQQENKDISIVCEDENNTTMTLLVDRRQSMEFDILKIYMNDNDILDKVMCDYCLTFAFNYDYITNTVKSYIQWGLKHHVRFVPEMMVSLLPRIFDKEAFQGTEYQRLKFVHSNQYKNGVSLKLKDEKFEDLYKMITNYQLLNVNYDRNAIKENISADMCIYDNILNITCNGSTPPSECSFILDLVDIIKANKESTQLINYNHLERLSKGYDHIIRCHDIFQNTECKDKVRTFIINCIDQKGRGCIYTTQNTKCPMLLKHMKTAAGRENITGGMDSLYQFLKSKDVEQKYIIEIYKWFESDDYDTDSVIFDAMEDDSNLLHMLNQNINTASTVYEFIRIHMGSSPIDAYSEEKEIRNIIAKKIYISIHCYLVHEEQDLYRNDIYNRVGKRFSSHVLDQSDAIYQIDFGINVLEWLEYNEKPTFDNFSEEILKNPSSTITPQEYNQYHENCQLLCNIAPFDINLEEMISLKLYTDTTVFQSSLRQAFWKSSSHEQRQNFFHWAITLYKTFKRYSQPLKYFREDDCKEPVLVYHGLDKVFVVESQLPFYNGIISLTYSKNTAHQFTKGSGLLWSLRGSYSNRFKEITGISTGWFSIFKNEAEIISFNSYLPIQSTKCFITLMEDKINVLMKQLQVYSQRITNKKSFFKKMGFSVSERSINMFLKHPKLYATTPIENYLVIHRLVHELKYLQHTKIGQFLLSCPELKAMAYYGNGAFIQVEWKEDNINYNQLDDMKACDFSQDVVEIADDIKCQHLLVTDDDKSFNIFVRNNKLFQYKNCVFLCQVDTKKATEKQTQFSFDSIRINKEIEISNWDKQSNRGGVLQLKCEGTLVIEKGAGINANGKGYYFGHGMGGYGALKENNNENDKQLTVLKFGASGLYRGGGIIEIIARKIINKGYITADGLAGGSGGSIKLTCKEFINKGVISAKSANMNGDDFDGNASPGNIAIFCDNHNESPAEIKPVAWMHQGYKFDSVSKEFTKILHQHLL